ncbi:hypothetical protein ACG7TL_000430 [Trametes sanguinea]
MASTNNDIPGTGLGLVEGWVHTYIESSVANSQTSDDGVVARPSAECNLTTSQVVISVYGFTATGPEKSTAPESMEFDDSSASEDEDGLEPYDGTRWIPKGGSTNNSTGKPKEVVKPPGSK